MSESAPRFRRNEAAQATDGGAPTSTSAALEATLDAERW